MPSRPGSRASRASTPQKGPGSRASRASTPKSRAGSRASRASTPQREADDSDLSDTASEGEAENQQDTADRIAELDELGLARWGPEVLEKIDRRCVGALALLRGKSFAGCLRRELQQKQSDRRLLCRYPLGPDELRTVFAYNRHKAILERPKTAPGEEPVPRHKRRDAEAAKRAAEAAARDRARRAVCPGRPSESPSRARVGSVTRTHPIQVTPLQQRAVVVTVFYP